MLSFLIADFLRVFFFHFAIVRLHNHRKFQSVSRDFFSRVLILEILIYFLRISASPIPPLPQGKNPVLAVAKEIKLYSEISM